VKKNQFTVKFEEGVQDKGKKFGLLKFKIFRKKLKKSKSFFLFNRIQVTKEKEPRHLQNLELTIREKTLNAEEVGNCLFSSVIFSETIFPFKWKQRI